MKQGIKKERALSVWVVFWFVPWTRERLFMFPGLCDYICDILLYISNVTLKWQRERKERLSSIN